MTRHVAGCPARAARHAAMRSWATGWWRWRGSGNCVRRRRGAI